MTDHEIQIISLWITGIGVTVGVGVLIVYICQLRAMKGQLQASIDGAKAAKDAADAALNANRAWILVEKISPPPEMFPRVQTQVRNEMTALLFVFQLKVFGRTPARIIESRFRFRLVPSRKRGVVKEADLPEPPNYGQTVTSSDNPEMNKTLFPEEPFSGTVTLEDGIDSFMPPNDQLWAELVKKEKFLCAYCFIKYQDAFDGAPIRETHFCYVYRIAVGGILVDPQTGKPLDPDGFRVGGPSGYNNAT
jgi:hypothetical protein